MYLKTLVILVISQLQLSFKCSTTYPSSTLETQQEESKHQNEYNSSVTDLKQCIDRLKSDYKLLALENQTLQEMLEKGMNRNRESKSYDRQNLSENRVYSRSQINPYESLPLESAQKLESLERSNQRYYSLRRTEERKRYTPQCIGSKSPVAVHQLQARNLRNMDEAYYASQSPVLQQSIAHSAAENRRSKVSLNSNLAWIPNPF